MIQYILHFFSSLCKKKERDKEIYVLQLENNKYYVVESYNKNNRIQNHIEGMGSAWTKKHKVINEIKPLTKKQNTFWELYETLELIHKYGIDNVRGSLFTSPYNINENDKVMAAQLYCELYGLCRNCGRNDHFISQCKHKEYAPWVEKFGGQLYLCKNRLCQECGLNIKNLPIYQKYCKQCYFKDFNKTKMN